MNDELEVKVSAPGQLTVSAKKRLIELTQAYSKDVVSAASVGRSEVTGEMLEDANLLLRLGRGPRRRASAGLMAARLSSFAGTLIAGWLANVATTPLGAAAFAVVFAVSLIVFAVTTLGERGD